MDDAGKCEQEMRIGELARAAELNPRTLRYYEQLGLLRPFARTEAGYRIYTVKMHNALHSFGLLSPPDYPLPR